MSETLSAEQVLEREFLPVRAKILEIAASLDRIERADGSIAREQQWNTLLTAIRTLLEEEPGRAEQIQLLFSREYQREWREEFGLK